MRTTVPCWLLLACAALPAQEDAAARKPEPVTPAAELSQAFERAQREWTQELRAASQSHDQDALARLRRSPPEQEFVPRFLEGAAAHAGTPAAVPYLVWIVSRGGAQQAKQAMTTLMEEHVGDPGITLAVARIGGMHGAFGLEQSRTWLDRVLEHNDSAAVQAQARFTRASLYVGTRAAKTSEELRRQAIADLEAVLQGEPNRSLRGLASSLLDEAKRLEPGAVAPEIAGEDLDGVPFELSDYRGKVVMLDFWGDW